MIISGNIVDVFKSRIFPGTLEIRDGIIAKIAQDESANYDTYIIPGFIDSHIHIESSMLTPSEFARAAVAHGSVAAVCDPHEIANVLGVKGIEYMLDNAASSPMKFYFGASSCVPATSFETSGGKLDTEEIRQLLQKKEIKFLGEMMNVPGVLFNDESVLEKIAIARMYGKKIDGHAPGLRGEALQAYIHAGPSTDHESFSESEAMEKIALGMKIQIREGSAARNFDALSRLMRQYPEQCMLCSDDLHPNDLIQGHINALVKKAIQKGIDKMKVLWCASVTPTLHYGLEVGLLRENDPADFLVIDDFERLTILKTYINGKLVAENGESLIPSVPVQVANNFKTNPKNEADFYIFHQGETVEANVIEANDGQLVTNRVCENLKVVNGFVMPDVERDILKIAVINRYQDGPIALGFIKNFGLTRGAIASSVAHDSHNIIAIGATDKAICDAANLIIEHRGGLSVVDGEAREVLPLPIAGIMTDLDGFEAARGYERLDRLAKKLGSTLRAPFMTLSFMALIVIPRLKLSDKGLFDCDQFQYVSLFDCK